VSIDSDIFGDVLAQSKKRRFREYKEAAESVASSVSLGIVRIYKRDRY
jgi:hypothetical protein